MQAQLASFDGAVQAGLQIETLAVCLLQIRLETQNRVASGLLGCSQRDPSLGQQRLDPGIRTHRTGNTCGNAHRDTEHTLQPTADHRPMQFGHHDLGCAKRSSLRAQLRKTGGKFVAGDAPQDDPRQIPERMAQARGHLSQGCITRLGAEGIIDSLEAIDIDEQQHRRMSGVTL